MTFGELRERIGRQWRIASYPTAFQANALPHRDFEHALIHVVKATGKLAAMVDDWDHSRGVCYRRAELKNLLADLVICAEKLASETEIDLGRAIEDRVDALDERWGKKRLVFSTAADTRCSTVDGKIVPH